MIYYRICKFLKLFSGCFLFLGFFIIFLCNVDQDDPCLGFCVYGGTCTLDENDNPVCHCLPGLNGTHCEERNVVFFHSNIKIHKLVSAF